MVTVDINLSERFVLIRHSDQDSQHKPLGYKSPAELEPLLEICPVSAGLRCFPSLISVARLPDWVLDVQVSPGVGEVRTNQADGDDACG